MFIYWLPLFILFSISIFVLIPFDMPKKETPLEEAKRRFAKAQFDANVIISNNKTEAEIIRLNEATEKLYNDMYKETLDDEIKVKSFCE